MSDSNESSTWSDAQLLTASRGAEHASAALNVLVRRHAGALRRRCTMLTHDRELAADLAQDTWTRMLRARETLRAEGSFGAYLARIALNLWRDRRRAEGQPGLLWLSLESSDDDCSLGDVLSDPLVGEETMSLRLDLDSALARLPHRLRSVVIARYIRGESAAEIGRRAGRSEQTITAWLREATAQLRENLREWRPAA